MGEQGLQEGAEHTPLWGPSVEDQGSRGICCEMVRYYLLDSAALSEIEAQAFHNTLTITSAKNVYVTNTISFNFIPP
jgi:hypothetical protein